MFALRGKTKLRILCKVASRSTFSYRQQLLIVGYWFPDEYSAHFRQVAALQ